MSMAETGINESPGHHPGGHVRMGLHCKAEPDKHERTGGKGQRASWPFQSLEKHHQSTFGWLLPILLLITNLPGRQPSAFPAHLTCLQKLCRGGFVFHWKTEALVMYNTSKSSLIPAPLIVFQSFWTSLCYRWPRDTQSCSVELQLSSLPLCGKLSSPPLTYSFQYSWNPEICLVFNSLLDWL